MWHLGLGIAVVGARRLRRVFAGDDRSRPITALTGPSGAGKTRRLVERVNQARADGRMTANVVCSSHSLIMTREEFTVHRVLPCRVPGLVAPLDHVVSPRACAMMLRRLPAGALATFDEAQYFGAEIVPAWLEAAGRGVEILLTNPIDEQVEALGDRVVEERLTMPCERCGLRDATTSYLAPDSDATVSVCAGCDEKLVTSARAEIVRRLEEQAPHPGQRIIYQPVGLSECAGWEVLRPDSEVRFDLMTLVLEAVGVYRRDPRERTPAFYSYLDVGSNTGYFCRQAALLWLRSEGVDVVEGDIEVARLLSSFVARDTVRYTVADCHDYLRDTQQQRFDVTSAFSVFQWLMVQRSSAQHGIDCLQWLFAKTVRVCFLEMGYSAEGHYRDKLGVDVDREWVQRQMVDSGAFARMAVIDGAANGLMRDLFVGLHAPRLVVPDLWRALKLEEFR
ncbi:MAG TPA: methyltransferase domain-containing protein [Candidatus Dormibacteraeota bacterium]